MTERELLKKQSDIPAWIELKTDEGWIVWEHCESVEQANKRVDELSAVWSRDIMRVETPE